MGLSTGEGNRILPGSSGCPRHLILAESGPKCTKWSLFPAYPISMFPVGKLTRSSFRTTWGWFQNEVLLVASGQIPRPRALVPTFSFSLPPWHRAQMVVPGTPSALGKQDCLCSNIQLARERWVFVRQTAIWLMGLALEQEQAAYVSRLLEIWVMVRIWSRCACGHGALHLVTLLMGSNTYTQDCWWKERVAMYSNSNDWLW